jgi:hypothetical protein
MLAALAGRCGNGVDLADWLRPNRRWMRQPMRPDHRSGSRLRPWGGPGDDARRVASGPAVID